MYFGKFWHKTRKCKGARQCILVNFNPKQEKSEGGSQCIEVNFETKLENVKGLDNVFW